MSKSFAFERVRRNRVVDGAFQRSIFLMAYADATRASADGPSMAACRRALLESAGKPLAGEERAWIKRIEGRRAQLEGINGSIAHPTEPSGLNTVGGFTEQVSIRPIWGNFIFRLVRRGMPKSALELGTAVGLSALYQGAALQLNATGRLTTIELEQARVLIAKDGATQLGLTNISFEAGNFTDVLEPILENVKPIDFAFIDGHHDEDATKLYFERIGDEATSGAILLFDDISWSDGMKRAWREIAASDRLAWAHDLGRMGLCVLK